MPNRVLRQADLNTFVDPGNVSRIQRTFSPIAGEKLCLVIDGALACTERLTTSPTHSPIVLHLADRPKAQHSFFCHQLERLCPVDYHQQDGARSAGIKPIEFGDSSERSRYVRRQADLEVPLAGISAYMWVCLLQHRVRLVDYGQGRQLGSTGFDVANDL